MFKVLNQLRAHDASINKTWQQAEQGMYVQSPSDCIFLWPAGSLISWPSNSFEIITWQPKRELQFAKFEDKNHATTQQNRLRHGHRHRHRTEGTAQRRHLRVFKMKRLQRYKVTLNHNLWELSVVRYHIKHVTLIIRRLHKRTLGGTSQRQRGSATMKIPALIYWTFPAIK